MVYLWRLSLTYRNLIIFMLSVKISHPTRKVLKSPSIATNELGENGQVMFFLSLYKFIWIFIHYIVYFHVFIKILFYLKNISDYLNFDWYFCFWLFSFRRKRSLTRVGILSWINRFEGLNLIKIPQFLNILSYTIF